MCTCDRDGLALRCVARCLVLTQMCEWVDSAGGMGCDCFMLFAEHGNINLPLFAIFMGAVQ